MSRRSASRLILAIDIGERLPVAVAHYVAGIGLFDGLRWREASAFSHAADVAAAFLPRPLMRRRAAQAPTLSRWSRMTRQRRS
jgi:hypothetical protein